MSTQYRSRSLTKSDLEASRLVFVYVRDAKPKRKVAVPVPEGFTWEGFINQTKTKLRLSGGITVYLASSGQRIMSLEELQDIDELCVVEGPLEIGSPNSGDVALRSGESASTSGLQGGAHSQYITPEKHKIYISDGNPVPGSSSVEGIKSPLADDDEGKYRIRIHPLQRLLKRLLPSLFPHRLPVTTRDADEGHSGGAVGQEGALLRGRRRRAGDRRSVQSLGLVLLVLAALSMLLLPMLWWSIRGGRSQTEEVSLPPAVAT